MKSRIALAADKGCDGIDPDNVENYDDGNYFGLTKQDAIIYVKKMADLAHSYGMSMGLKNGVDMVHDVLDNIEFGVNESCASSDGDCDYYQELTAAGKPVLHVEYVDSYSVQNGQMIIGNSGQSSDQLKALYCFNSNQKYASTFSTTIKVLSLNGWVLYCDDSWNTTATTSDGVHKGQIDCPNGN